MKRTLTTGLTLIALLTIGLISCSDDNNNPTGSNIPPIMVQGSINISDGALGGAIEFWDLTYSGKHPDSVQIGHLKFTNMENWYWVPDDNYWAVSLWSLHDSTYHSGDTIDVRIYYGSEIATVTLVLLDNEVDGVDLVTEPLDPHALNANMEFAWNELEGIDYYGVTTWFERFDSTLVQCCWPFVQEWNKSSIASDTTFTIAGSMFDNDGTISVSIMAIRGPKPTAEGVLPVNISTPSMRGQIWSHSRTWKSYKVGADHGYSPTITGDDIPDPLESIKKLVRD